MQKVTLSVNLVNAILSYVAGSYSKSMTNGEVNQLIELIKSEANESLKPEVKEPEQETLPQE